MALTTIHRPTEHPFLTAMAVALAALIAFAAFFVYLGSDASVDTVRSPQTISLDSSQGPNQDLAPVWGIERSPADVLRAESARRGPNQDLAPVWGSQTRPIEVTGSAGTTTDAHRGPNQDLAPGWGSDTSVPSNRGPNQDLAPVWGS